MMITVFQACSDGNTRAILRSIKTLQRDGFGNTLHVACLNGRVETARILIRAGAPIDSLDEEGVTPIQRARQNGSPEIMRMIDNSDNL